MTETPVIPLTYCGSIDYFMILAHYPKVLVEVNESYQKQTLRNRCRIYSANGPLDLVIPIKHTESKLISGIHPDNSVNWQRQHWYALTTAYRKSPFYEFYADDLQPFFENRYELLADFNLALTKKICRLTKLDCAFENTSDYLQYPAVCDFRNSFKPAKTPRIFVQEAYIQTFGEKFGFVPNLSILDLLFNLGPGVFTYLRMQSVHKFVESV